MPEEISRALLEKDAELARLGRCEAQLKLRLGDLLDVLFERGGHHELGFSSIDAYVVERCERSRSWGRETRAFARRLREKGLNEIRHAVRAGRLGFSMAELIARHATRENESTLLAQAQTSTVREMQRALTGKAQDDSQERAPRNRITYWVTEDDVAMLSASRVLVEYLNGARPNDEALLTALLGEAETSLQSIRSPQAATSPLDRAKFEAIAAVLRDSATPRSKTPPSTPPILIEVAPEDPTPSGLRDLDREIIRCARELARRNLQMGRLVIAVFASKVWRKLGYDSPAHYANERIGVSLSSLEHRMTLARRVARHPSLGDALDRGLIGYEAALMITRVLGRFAARDLIDAWIDRAQHRTAKHLREEIDAVLLAVELDANTSRFSLRTKMISKPPFDFQRKIHSGELLWILRPPQMSVALSTLDGTRRPLEFTIPPDLYAHWRDVEAQFRELAGDGGTFVAFACTSLWQTWLPFIEAWDDKWKQVYRRDRHRCTSPVCERRDVTPHHVRFKSHGGSDAAENMTSACAWCHLQGIHRGRLSAEGPASKLTWVVGRHPIMVVAGRERAGGQAA